ncbi:MAG: peptidyl-alpha-hydroxyglycine alpha-amidating lyase family protein [Planctomycetota bacterium]|nr:peptidyl-alpha-hydroxyglycine alpha-amidating lyase family protein [Planctomycetota bacterium]
MKRSGRNRRGLHFACLLMFGLGASPLSGVEPFTYSPVPDFFRLPEGLSLGACTGVDVDSKGNVYLLHRGKHPVVCLDASGRFIRSWGDECIETPHGLRIDRNDNVWVTDIGNHQVFQFSSSGARIVTLGKAGTAGNGIDEFNQPTDVAFGARGEIYVADGYGNSRVIKFTPHGGFLGSWGKAGKGRGEFDTPHAIVVDRQQRVIVGDRENDRLQVFTANGELLAVWPGFAPYGVARDRQGNLFIADGRANKILQLNDAGKVIASWGSEGAGAGQFQLPHMLATDRRGDLYVGEIKGQRFQKFARKHGRR